LENIFGTPPAVLSNANIGDNPLIPKEPPLVVLETLTVGFVVVAVKFPPTVRVESGLVSPIPMFPPFGCKFKGYGTAKLLSLAWIYAP